MKMLRRLLHFLRGRAERDLHEEMALHLELQRHDLEAAGLDAATADAHARRAMGSRLLAEDDARDVWVWPGLRGLSLDVRLGLRMLLKYPGLTIVGGAALAFGIAAGAGGFEIRTQMTEPRLPLDEGHRVVGLRVWDTRTSRPAPSNAEGFAMWREAMTTVHDLSAVVLHEHNLLVDGQAEPVEVAEMTASGFRVLRVAPLLGRTLQERDQSPGAARVAVIGHSIWSARFLADPEVVGRTVQIGTEPTTIVGVMPEGFGFPIAHRVWIPLEQDPRPVATDDASLLVFGRLAPGASIERAQAELTTVGIGTTPGPREAVAFLQPQVVPYSDLILDSREYWLGLALANTFLVMLVVLVSANVALLMFARAAARESEIAVRSALGASRGRIVSQLFIEALVLATVAVVLGLSAARSGVRSFWRMYEADSGAALPFWLTERLTPATVAYAVGLAVLGATIAGVLPALHVTGRGRQGRLRQSTGGGGGSRFRGIWTVVIVAQVAVTVTFPAAAFFFHRWVVAEQARDVGFPAEEYLSARLVLDETRDPGSSSAAFEELRRRLVAEPGVTAVTFADRLPGTLHNRVRYELEGDSAPPENGYDVRVASVDADFLDALSAPIISGRGFTIADVESAREVAIVNASFVDGVLQGRSPVGRRVRRSALDSERPPGPWIEVVGVVRDLGVIGSDGIGLYRPLALDRALSVHTAIHVRGEPESLAPRLRALASDVDPTLRLYDPMPLDAVGAGLWLESQYLSRLLMGLSGIALLLSLAAIYAVLTFTVAQRTREIGVRVALGAHPWWIIAAILRRPLGQIGAGIGVGAVLVGLVFTGLFESTPTLAEVALIAAYAALMLGVCLLACIGPTRRALRLEPSDVLRADG